MTIENVLLQIKTELESAITTAKWNGNNYADGVEAKTALICSQGLIKQIHEFIKSEFIRLKVKSCRLYPPLGNSSPELKLEGILKKKDQDVSIVPKSVVVKDNKINGDVEKIISVNVRSQLSSLSKNFDTLYERTFAESLNLHMRYPSQCLGEVYFIPTHEYDDKAMRENQVAFKKLTNIEKYIEMFQQINSRKSVTSDAHKYERVCLLIVNFNHSIPKIYSTIQELKNDKLVSVDSTLSMEFLNIDSFAKDLLDIYKERFNIQELL